MKQNLFRYTFWMGCLYLSACSASAGESYTNPVINISVPDPTVIHADDGYYYLYGTEDIRNLPVFRSRDMVEWTQVGVAFTDGTRPADVEGASLWAPEIRYVKGKYVLFYSLAIWGQEWVSTVGYAVADRPEGPFTPKGVVFGSRDIGVQNSIDQFFYEEDGKYYMLWGSFRGIYLMELDVEDDLTITPRPETKRQVAGTAFEAVNIWKRDGYYYLFASIGSCCEGANSTYTMVVGRADKLSGPYLSRDGRPMMDNAYMPIISKNSAFVGPGHNSILVEDDEGSTWVYYHAYHADCPENGRVVLLDRVCWDDAGWPYVNDGHASIGAVRPVINK